jgi:sugar (pentulose or hexulose) kinase
MRGEVLIGIDAGTTALKAAAFDAGTGRTLARAEVRLPVVAGADGSREQDPAALTRALHGALACLQRQLGRRRNDIAGAGLAAQGGSGMLVERRTGIPCTRLMLWNDARPFRYLTRLTRTHSPSFWRRHTFRDGPGQGLGRFLWLKETSPKLLRGAYLHVGAGEYLYFRLTGVWRQDPCHALQTGCYNVPRRRLDQRLLDLVGLPLSLVAPLREGHTVEPLAKSAARRLGLPKGIPVAGPYMDHEAGYLSALGAAARPLQFSLGTAWVGSYALPRSARWRSPVQLVLPALAGEGWLVVQPLLTGNVTWDWALAQWADADHARALEKLDKLFADDPLPPEGLTALPWLNWPNPLALGAHGGGALLGLSPRTQPAELLRAVAAAMAFETFRVFREVVRRRTVDAVVLSGGASQGAFFRSLLAGLFAPLPVFALEEPGVGGARGTLYPFSPRLARAVSARVPPPRGGLAERIARGLRLYLAAFARFYGHVPAGTPIAFPGNVKGSRA